LKDLYPAEIKLSGRHIADKPGQQPHTFRIEGFETEERLYGPIDCDEIHIHPVDAELFGAKSGGFLKIAIGTVLVVTAIASGGLAAGAAGSFLATAATTAFSLGTAMALGGILELLSLAPKSGLSGPGAAADPDASKYLGAPKNTVRIGTRIPLLYGEHIAYGHYLSFDIDAKDVAV
jgi:predicted phage tail protein